MIGGLSTPYRRRVASPGRPHTVLQGRRAGSGQADARGRVPRSSRRAPRIPAAWGFAHLTCWDSAVSSAGESRAGDGIYGASIDPIATNLTIVEFYVSATDAGAHTRTWPGPTNGSGAQGANALYQVDNAYDPSADWDPAAVPEYRVIVRQADFTSWLSAVSADRYNNTQLNATFISVDGTGLRLRY